MQTLCIPISEAAHNIVINEESDRAYIVGARGAGEICGGGFHILDISKPLEPSFLGCFADVGTGRSRTGYTHDAQCVTYHGPDTFHAGREICVGSNETAISISDLTKRIPPPRLLCREVPIHLPVTSIKAGSPRIIGISFRMMRWMSA